MDDGKAILEHVESEKGLGVTIDEALGFEEHIYGKVKIATTMVGLIRPVYSYLDEPSLSPL